jgi:hypothetical protein
MGFHDDLDALTSGLAEDSDMTPYDNLRTAYNDLEAGSAAKVGELESANASLEETNKSLRAHNYDLLMAQSRGNSPAVQGVLDETSNDTTDIVSMDDIISYE